MGIVFIALRKRLLGERESTLLDRHIGFSSAFSIAVRRDHFLAGLSAYGRFPNNHSCETSDQSFHQVAAAQRRRIRDVSRGSSKF
jgi:hypothetical protein